MKNLQSRIEKLEQHNGNRLINQFYVISCQFALEQGKPQPEKPCNVSDTFKQLARYLPN